MPSMTKSQISQVFIYILTLVVFALILVYGYKAIAKFVAKGEEINVLQIRKELENSIQKTSRDFGTVIRKEIEIPEKFLKICFVDLDQYAQAPPTDICNPSADGYNALVCDSWQSKAQFNMFFIKKSQEIEPFYVGDIDIPDYYNCSDVKQGRIVLRLEGTGGKTKIEAWE